jgi:hypothetical protein
MMKEAPAPTAEPSAQEKPEPEEAAPAKPARSDALRFIVSLVVGVALGVICVWVAYHFTHKMPTKVYYVPMIAIAGQETQQVLKAGLLFGALLGVLLGAVLSLTHWGPFAGLILGAALGYVSIWGVPYVGPAAGALAGIILGLIGTWGYKRPVLV